jgi:hypothetical protein
MADLQRTITELEQENQKLEFEIAKYRSMQSIQDRLAQMNLVAVGDVEYLDIVGNTVARR